MLWPLPKIYHGNCRQKREKLIEEAVHFEVRSKLKQLFFSQICQENVAMNKEFNLKRNYQTKQTYANAYDKPLGSCCLFSESESIKDCVMKIMVNTCPKKRQAFANVYLAHYTPAWTTGNNHQTLRDNRGIVEWILIFACDESTYTSTLFVMNLKEELLDHHRELIYLFLFVQLLLIWNNHGVKCAPAMAGEQSRLSTLICNKINKEGGNAIKPHFIIHQQVLHPKFKHVKSPIPLLVSAVPARHEHRHVVYHSDRGVHTEAVFLSGGNWTIFC